MQFLVTLTLDRLTSPPAELEAAMTEFVENRLQTGSFVISGGLASGADGVRVDLSPSGELQGDASLPVHGFAVVEAPSLEHTVGLHPGRCGYTRITSRIGQATARCGPL